MAIITICGSMKNKELMYCVSKKLEEKGHIVLTPTLQNIYRHMNCVDLEGKLLITKGTTFAHLNRIKTADVCVMINPKGYLGVGSTLELGYAVSLGKLIISLQHDEELARESLFDIVLECEDAKQITEKIDKILKDFNR